MGFCLKVTLPFLSSATAAAALCLSGFAVGKGGASWHAGRRCGGDGVPGFIAALSGVAARGWAARIYDTRRTRTLVQVGTEEAHEARESATRGDGA